MKTNKLFAKNQKNSPSHKTNLRADAAWALFEVLESGRSTRDIMPALFERYTKPQDRGWLQEATYGCLRELPILQFWTHTLLDRPLKGDKKIIEHLVMLGLFQIHFMRTLDHAAVSETVNAAKALNQPRFLGLVNAILRNFTRNNVADLPFPQPHIEYGLPKWLHKQLQQDYPEQWQNIAKQSNKKAPLWLRINKQKISVDEYSKHLDQAGIEHECHGIGAVKLISQTSVPKLPGYDDGWFNVQDYAAQQCMNLLPIDAGDTVLDCCAAPGGKTLALIDVNPALASLYAIDNVASRLDTLRENITRAHLSNEQKIVVLHADAAALSTHDKLPMFDKILLDAPCSASGIIRRHPDIKWLRKRADIDVLVALQSQILDEVWAKLKTGGTLLYATCSILPAENSKQIQTFLDRHDDATLVPIDEDSPHVGWQILPGEQEMDGFFYARLLKSK